MMSVASSTWVTTRRWMIPSAGLLAGMSPQVGICPAGTPPCASLVSDGVWMSKSPSTSAATKLSRTMRTLMSTFLNQDGGAGAVAFSGSSGTGTGCGGCADLRVTVPIVVVPGSVCAVHDATAFHQYLRGRLPCGGSPCAGPQPDMSGLLVTAVNVLPWFLAMIAASPLARLVARLLLRVQSLPPTVGVSWASKLA